MPRLSVTIITQDEERNLPDTLKSVEGVADEVIVVDSGSTDRTCEIARAAGVRVIDRAWTDYGDQKNFAAGQASHDWILSLDADERLSPELRAAVIEWKLTEPALAAFTFARRNNYLGGWVRHGGWYPDRKARLYDRRQARFAGTVHESLKFQGEAGHLSGDLLHYTMRTVEDHRRSTERYSTLAAGQRFAEGKRQWLLPLLFAPGWAFLRTYILQLGFLDGGRGWRIARMAARYSFLKYRKLGVLARGGILPAERPEARP